MQDKFTSYEERLSELWERMVRGIGIHTVNVLMERAIFQASQRHPELELIERTDEGLRYGALEAALKDRPESDIAEAFNDLVSELLLIMTRLLGTEMAHRLVAELEVKMAREHEVGEAERTGR
jgi:hypothetical protein